MLLSRWKKATLCLLASSLVLSFSGSGQSAMAQDDQITSYQSGTTYSFENQVPLAKPRWTAELSQPSTNSRFLQAFATGNGNVYIVKNGMMAARDIASGKKVWTFGSKLQEGAIVTAEDAVYAIGSDNSIYRINAKTGNGTRIYQLKDKTGQGQQGSISGISVDGNTMYATFSEGLLSLNLSTGQENWRNNSANYPSLPLRAGDILLEPTFESGAITVGTFYAIDRATGKTLWRLQDSHSGLLRVDGDKLYFPDDWPKNDSSKYVAAIDVVNLQTGKIIDTKSYVPIKAGEDPLYQNSEKLVMDGSDVYIYTRDQLIYKYHVDADPSAARPEIIQDRGQWIAGPYNGKLFYRNNDSLGVHARKIFDQSYVYYEGLDNPVSRLDLIASGMYVGQTDGEVYALNVSTGKALFRYQTSARNFGPFQVEGSTLLVQAEGKLYAFDLPAELRKPVPGGSAAGAFTKARAKLAIDGTELLSEPSMMATANKMFVPLRFLMNEIGAKVSDNTQTKQVTITYGEHKFSIAEGVPYAVAGDQQIALSFAPVMLNDNLYVAIGDVGKLLGVQVNWNAGARTVEVTTKNKK